MSQYPITYPYCGRTIHLCYIFDKNGRSHTGSGSCNYCRGKIKWWGENNRPKIAKNSFNFKAFLPTYKVCYLITTI